MKVGKNEMFRVSNIELDGFAIYLALKVTELSLLEI